MKPSPQPAANSTDVLRARARELARPPVPVMPSEAFIHVLEFRLAQERYAVETSLVEEVQPLRELTPLPCTPPFVLGIVNVRGRILPVLDLKKLFELPETGITDLHYIVLVRGPDLEFGLLADVVVGTREVVLQSLQPSLPTLTGIRGEYLKGVTPDRLVVLDLVRVFADSRIIVNEEVEN